MQSPRWRILTGLILSLVFAGCVSSAPERIDGNVVDKAQYDIDESSCRAQARNKFPTPTQKESLTRTPLEIPKTDNRPFSIMEFNSCMRLKGWKNF